VVNLLLEQGVGVNRIDCYGRTALSRGAANGHKQVMEVLLEREGVKAETAATAGQCSQRAR